MVELTPEQLKKLKQLARIEKNPTLEIVNEISSVKNVLKKTKETNTALLEQINNLSTIDIDDVKNDIIGSIDKIRLIIEQYAINSKKDAQKEVNNQEKDKKLGEIKNSITEAIQRLAESIPEINDYNDQLNQILIELNDNEKAENIIKKLDELRTSILEKDFPKNLTEDDQVKVKLSEEQIKKILKGLNVQVVNASSEYAVDISGKRINRATLEGQTAIQGKIEDTNNTLQNILTEQGKDKVITNYHSSRLFTDEFFDLSNWDLVQLGTGMSYQLRGSSNGARFLAINSGTVNGAETIFKAKTIFRPPFKMIAGVSVTLSSDTSGAATTGRNANILPIVEIVECDANGNVIETASSQTYSGLVPNCLAYVFDGTTNTTQRVVMRSYGNSEYQTTSAMGSYATTLPTGNYPDYIQASNFIFVNNNEFIYYYGDRCDTLTANTLFKKHTIVPDPTRYYTLRIRLKNTATISSASVADFNIHTIQIQDANRVSVDLNLVANVGTDLQSSIPVYVGNAPNVYAYIRPTTTYGSSSFHSAIMSNSTNETLVKSSVAVVNSIQLSNSGNDDVWFKLYNKASIPVLSSDVPVARIMIPAGCSLVFSGGVFSMRFSTGLGYAVTKGISNTDTTAVEADKITVSINYD